MIFTFLVGAGGFALAVLGVIESVCGPIDGGTQKGVSWALISGLLILFGAIALGVWLSR